MAPPTITPDAMEDHFLSWTNSTRTLAHYERYEQIGEGTYGQVYRAKCRDTHRVVALKKMRIHHGGYWGMPLQFIREIKILKKLSHPNLLEMIEVVTSKGVEHLDKDDAPKHKIEDKVADAREGYKGNLFLVLEYVTHDLTGLMDVGYPFEQVHIKCIFRQLLQALAFMHEHKYVHRDIKSSNILLDDHFRVKLADFGLARSLEPPILDQVQGRTLTSGELTNKVITLWYRPPEILLGSQHYGTNVDVWSAGCILAELLLNKPLFCGKTEMEQLNLIVDMLGSPSEDTWEHLKTFRRAKDVEVDHSKKSRLGSKYRNKINPVALNFLEKMLEWNDRKRISASSALQNRYFLAQPIAPDNPAELGRLEGHFHEFLTKRKRKEAKAVADEAKAKARLEGASDEAAQEAFDNVYRDLMKQVAEKGVQEAQLDEQKPSTTMVSATEAAALPRTSSSRRTEPDRGASERKDRQESGRDEADGSKKRKKKKRRRDEDRKRRHSDESRKKKRKDSDYRHEVRREDDRHRYDRPREGRPMPPAEYGGPPQGGFYEPWDHRHNYDAPRDRDRSGQPPGADRYGGPSRDPHGPPPDLRGRDDDPYYGHGPPPPLHDGRRRGDHDYYGRRDDRPPRRRDDRDRGPPRHEGHYGPPRDDRRR